VGGGSAAAAARAASSARRRRICGLAAASAPGRHQGLRHQGLLLGGRQLGFLAGAYAANVLVFLTSLFAIARRALGLRYVWAALAAFQLVRVCEFATRVRAVGLLDSLLPAWLRRRAASPATE